MKRKGSYRQSQNKRFRLMDIARNAINTGLKYGPAAWTAYNRTQRNTSGIGVTSQYDTKKIYTRKRMPKRKRVAWKKFVNKTNSVLMKTVGTKTVIRNDQLSRLWNGTGQEIAVATVYGADGLAATVTQCGHRDLAEIFANDPDLQEETAHAHFGTAVVDLTMVNMSNNTSETPKPIGLEVDVYDVTYWKQSDAQTLGSMFITAAANTDVINGAGNSITYQSRGATPFDFPYLGAHGVKILAKRKYFLGFGQTATYQLRIPKNYRIRHDDINNANEDFVRPKVTRSILIFAKGLPGADEDVNKLLNIGVTRKYMYKVFKNNIDADQEL